MPSSREWGGLCDGEQITVSSLQVALKWKEEHDGKIFIADGKNTKELDETKIHDYLEEEYYE